MNFLKMGGRGPQGLKPSFLLVLNGTAEAVPYPKPIYEARSQNSVPGPVSRLPIIEFGRMLTHL